MKTILVVDDMTIFREPIAASLRLAGYETLCAADGEEALSKTRTHHPDLILLDISMPKMDGLTFLKHLRDDKTIAKTPVILLTALSEKKSVVAAAGLGVRSYLLKSRFRLAELLDRIKKLESPGAENQTVSEPTSASSLSNKASQSKASVPDNGPIKQLLTREQFLERMEKAFETKTLSGVVAQVIALASSPRGDATQLAELIARDPMLSARVLQAANSASYGPAGPAVTNIAGATRKVGFTAVRNIAAALGVFDCMPEAGADGFNPIRCWQHSFAVAQLCERLASANLPDQGGLAYIVGLCHDLGDIFIRTLFSKEYQQVVEMAEKSKRAFDLVHLQLLGMTPSQTINAVMKCMRLPDAIRAPIEIHHAQSDPQQMTPLSRILCMADNYANATMLASTGNSKLSALTQAFCHSAVGQRNPSRPDPSALRSEVFGITVALAGLSRADEAKLLVPLFKKSSSRVWVAREPSISDFDPVGVALASLAEISIHQQLPTKADLQELDGLVVISPSTHARGFSRQEINSLAGSCGARALPVLAITSDPASLDPTSRDPASDGMRWCNSLALSELATFVQKLSERPVARAA